MYRFLAHFSCKVRDESAWNDKKQEENLLKMVYWAYDLCEFK